jgi:hypothetical protein
MKLLLQNTTLGLKPLYDADYDEKKKLHLGEVYEATIRVPRNINFHRKFFALLNCAWEYLNEKQQREMGNIEQFRKYLEVKAGYYQLWHSPDLNLVLRIPTSIAFDKMDDAEFGNLYERVKDVLFAEFLTNISEKEFTNNLASF